MKNLASVGSAVLLLLCLAVFASPFAPLAFAGDRLLGVILVTDGGTASNATTGYGSAGCSHEYDPAGADACAQSFAIGPNQKLTVQCKDQGAKFSANRYATDAGQGVTLAADQFFPTSVGQSIFVPAGTAAIAGLLDGGTYTGAAVAISPLAGASRAECNIMAPDGKE